MTRNQLVLLVGTLALVVLTVFLVSTMVLGPIGGVPINHGRIANT